MFNLELESPNSPKSDITPCYQIIRLRLVDEPIGVHREGLALYSLVDFSSSWKRDSKSASHSAHSTCPFGFFLSSAKNFFMLPRRALIQMKVHFRIPIALIWLYSFQFSLGSFRLRRPIWKSECRYHRYNCNGRNGKISNCIFHLFISKRGSNSEDPGQSSYEFSFASHVCMWWLTLRLTNQAISFLDILPSAVASIRLNIVFRLNNSCAVHESSPLVTEFLDGDAAEPDAAVSRLLLPLPLLNERWLTLPKCRFFVVAHLGCGTKG